MDKLTGPSVQLYSVAWHPVRSFIAAATSDGHIDMWGQRIDWTHFAPDFQALPMNLEYIEGEEEVDKDSNGRYLVTQRDQSHVTESSPGTFIDVITVESVPVFASESEEEEDVFAFEAKIKNSFLGRKPVKMIQLED